MLSSLFLTIILAQKNKVWLFQKINLQTSTFIDNLLQITMKGVDCTFAADTISNVTCKYKGIRNKFGMFSYGMTLIRVVRKAEVTI
jgi:hypothetical protein